MGQWQVAVSGPVVRSLERLPEKYAHAVIRLFDALAENPERLGKPLRFELEGLWSARRGPYRVIYEINRDNSTVVILKVAHRADVYRG